MVKYKKVMTEFRYLTVDFVAYQGNVSEIVELNYCYSDRTYHICTSNEESVSMKGKSILSAELKLKALQECIKFIKYDIQKGKK